MIGEYKIIIQMLAALAVGLLIGIERGWSGREEDEGDRIAGIRTFSLIGMLGGISAQLSVVLAQWVFGITFIAVVAMIITAHVVSIRASDDIGITTEFAMLLTFALAAWAAFGYYVYAFATTAVVVALLSIKPVLHRGLRHLETPEFYAGIKLLIISLVLLPLLPNQGYGPWNALNPYWIWWMVVLISGISFVGYFAIKFGGNRMGTLLTAITGGLASSTAVTLSLAQLARPHKNKRLFMSGVVVAASIMFIRMFVEVAVVNAALLDRLWLPALVMFLCLMAGGVWLWFGHKEKEASEEIEIKNPFKLSTALQFGALLGFIMLLSESAQSWFGNEGVYLLSLISGLVDVDAIALSLSRLALNTLDDSVAVMGILIASAVNTVIKGFLFAFYVGYRPSLKLITILFVAVTPGLVIALMMG
jgi:uncharacterized membrane protein (DUF4010 family)